MSLFAPKFEKLIIESHKKKSRDDVKPKTFEAMFNPESYSRAYRNVYSRKQGINTTGREAKYILTPPEDLSIKLILDGTGVDETKLLLQNLFVNPLKDISKEVDRFLNLTGSMDGDLHEPKYLILKWGNLRFKCRLGSVTVNYTLFGSNGIPIRAELDTQFFKDVEDSERESEEGKNSPDLTHIRVVEAHDRLPLMCEEIYGSPQYYVYVAQANQLDDFRNLKPGQEIYFPPIEK